MKIKKALLLEECQNFNNDTLIVTVLDHHGAILMGSPLAFSKNFELMCRMKEAHANRIYYLAEREQVEHLNTEKFI